MSYRDFFGILLKNKLPERFSSVTSEGTRKQNRLVSRNPLIILLLVIILCSGLTNVYVLTKFGKNRSSSNTDLDKEQIDREYELLKDQELSKKVKFVALEENEELRRIRRYSREIPAGRLDQAAKRDIEKIYKPEKIHPNIKSYKNENEQQKEKDHHKQETEDKINSHDVIDKKKKRKITVVDDDEDNETKGKHSTYQKSKRRIVPQELYKLAPEIFDKVPLRFEDHLKNPCWRPQSKKSSLMCLPYFFILGMPKCGTSDMWFKLMHHPQIVHVVKEPHWWTRGRIGYQIEVQPFSYYLSWAKPITKEIQKGKRNVVFGDGSASTLWDNNGWRNNFPPNVTEPPYVVADIIRELLPDAKLIIMFRDPVSRLYSDYLYRGKPKEASASNFHIKVVRSIKSFQHCQKHKPIRACIYESQDDDNQVRLLIGLYYLFIRDWVQLFPINQFAFIDLEEWSTSCPSILPQVFNFLELDAMPTHSIHEICSKSPKNVNAYMKDKVGEMLPQTRRILQDFYRPFNKHFAKILGIRDLNW